MLFKSLCREVANSSHLPSQTPHYPHFFQPVFLQSRHQCADWRRGGAGHSNQSLPVLLALPPDLQISIRQDSDHQAEGGLPSIISEGCLPHPQCLSRRLEGEVLHRSSGVSAEGASVSHRLVPCIASGASSGSSGLGWRWPLLDIGLPVKQEL